MAFLSVLLKIIDNCEQGGKSAPYRLGQPLVGQKSDEEGADKVAGGLNLPPSLPNELAL